MQLTKGARAILIITAAIITAGCATTAATDPKLIQAALDNPARSAEDRERDARSHPEVILSLLDIKPGDTVADILGGGGYYADLIASIVGPNGEVILHNNTPYSTFVMKSLQQRIDNPVPPVQVLISEVDDLQLNNDRLDAALMVMSFHDLYYYNPERGWGKSDTGAFLQQMYQAMKPTARFVVVDHAAPPGAGSDAVQETHRIDEDFVRQVFAGAGFTLVDHSDVLRNPNDDKDKMVFDKSVRGTTDRFVLVFEK